MRPIGIRLACALVILSGLAQEACARPMAVMESRPAARAVMEGEATRFFVRFDGPVDHAASTLSVLRDGQVIRRLHARLNSQPDTLYATPGRLPPGNYVLHWSTRAMQARDVSEGDIPFTVTQSRR